MKLSRNISSVKVAKCMAKSAEMTRAVNDLISIPEMQKQMMGLAREMEKAGLIEELVGDAIDGAVGGEEVEADADAEVAKILTEMDIDFMDGTTVGTAALKTKIAEPEVAEEVDTSEEDALRARLEAL